MMSLPPGIAPEVARGVLGCQTTVLWRASSPRCWSVQSNRGKVLRRPADTTIAGLGCQMGSDIGFAMRARKRIRMWFFTVQLTLQRHFRVLTKFAHVESRLSGRQRPT